jgi:hypothetical protein
VSFAGLCGTSLDPGTFCSSVFSLVRHHTPTAGQIEVGSSKHIVSYLSGVALALIGPLPTFVSTVQHNCCSSS